MAQKFSTYRNSLKYRSNRCLNCGMALDLSDRYCRCCGQKNTTRRLSLFDYVGEFLLSIVTYDSRIVHTVRDLLTKPGRVSRNYIKGQRIRYANPFRFFLSVSIIYFLLNGVLNFLAPEELNFSGENVSESLSVALDSLKVSSGRTITNYNYIAENDLDTLTFLSKTSHQIELFREFYKTTEIKNAHRALDSLDYEENSYNLWLYNRNKVVDQIESNPTEFLSYVIEKTPFYLFFLAPFLALVFLILYFKWYSFGVVHKMTRAKLTSFKLIRNLPSKLRQILTIIISLLLWPLRVKRKINYMEHLIFIFHIFTFTFLGLLFCLIPDQFIKNDMAQKIFLLIAPIYFYKALRNFYRERRFLTIIKFLAINIVFLVLGGTLAVLFFAFTAATY